MGPCTSARQQWGRNCGGTDGGSQGSRWNLTPWPPSHSLSQGPTEDLHPKQGYTAWLEETLLSSTSGQRTIIAACKHSCSPAVSGKAYLFLGMNRKWHGCCQSSPGTSLPAETGDPRPCGTDSPLLLPQVLTEIPPFLQFRGGPQKYEVTGWLQIQGVRVTDEGTYRCFARNRVGEVVALASLTVFTPGEHCVLISMLSWGHGKGCLGTVHQYGRSCWSIGLCWGCPRKLLCMVRLWSWWGRGQAQQDGNVTLSPCCRFRPTQPDRLLPAEAPHDT